MLSLAGVIAELVGGYPYADIDTKTMDFLPWSGIRRVLESGPAGSIVFFDEMSDAKEDVQAATHQILTHRKFGAVQTPKGTALVAAGNPASISTTGGSLSTPVARRLCQIPWSITLREYTKGSRDEWPAPIIYALPDDWEDRISFWTDLHCSFLEAHPDQWMKDAEPNSSLNGMVLGKSAPSCSSRTWTMAHVLSAAADSLYLSLKAQGDFEAATAAKEARGVLLAGCVGEVAADQFYSWLRNMDLPDPEKVLADPLNYPDWWRLGVPPRSDQLRTTVSAVVTAALDTDSLPRWNAAWKFLHRTIEGNQESIGAMGAARLAGPLNVPSKLRDWPKEAEGFIRILEESGAIKSV